MLPNDSGVHKGVVVTGNCELGCVVIDIRHPHQQVALAHFRRLPSVTRPNGQLVEKYSIIVIQIIFFFLK